ncbi:hypothetical protein IAT40_000489 [Kwoniella sp. CBS 6097]
MPKATITPKVLDKTPTWQAFRRAMGHPPPPKSTEQNMLDVIEENDQSVIEAGFIGYERALAAKRRARPSKGKRDINKKRGPHRKKYGQASQAQPHSDEPKEDSADRASHPDFENLHTLLASLEPRLGSTLTHDLEPFMHRYQHDVVSQIEQMNRDVIRLVQSLAVQICKYKRTWPGEEGDKKLREEIIAMMPHFTADYAFCLERILNTLTGSVDIHQEQILRQRSSASPMPTSP